MRNNIVVKWVDNFSKCYAVAMQGASAGAFTDCQWTGKGFKVYVGDRVHTDIKGDLAAMPDDIFEYHQSRDVISGLVRVRQGGWLFLGRSLVKLHNVNTIPVKPRVSRRDDAKLHAVLAESRDGLRNFHPLEVSPQNIGSNRGLLLVLKKMSDARVDNGKFEFLCADCNIFMRIVKVSHRRININVMTPININVLCPTDVHVTSLILMPSRP